MPDFNSLVDFQKEYDRLWAWRDLWTRLSNRDSKVYPQKGNSGARRSANAVFLATLQVRNERVQQRAWLKNLQIRDLMKKLDAWKESQNCKHKKRKMIDFNEETWVATFLCPCGYKWTSKARFVCT